MSQDTNEAVQNLAYGKQLELGNKEFPDPVDAVRLPAEERKSSGHVVSIDYRKKLEFVSSC